MARPKYSSHRLSFAVSYWLTFATVALVFGVMGSLFFNGQIEQAEQSMRQTLDGLALSRAQRIAQWSMERRGDALLASSSPFVAAGVEALMRRPTDDSLRRSVVQYMEAVRRAYAYESVRLLDRGGREVIRVPASPRPPMRVDSSRVAARGIAEADLIDELFDDPATGLRRISFYARIGHMAGPSSPPAAAMVFEMNAADVLTGLVTGFPFASETGESILARQSGESALVFSPLRFDDGASLHGRLAIPSASRVVAGDFDSSHGVGLDYRGQAVLYSVRRVADTPWLVETKIDRHEVRAPIERHAAKFVVLIALLTTGVAFAVAFWRKTRDAEDDLLQSRANASRAIAIAASEERFARAVRATSDGIWEWTAAADSHYLSPHFESLLGYAVGELDGCSLELLAHPDDLADIRASIQAHLEDHVPLSRETRLARKDGTYQWFLTRGEAQFGDDGRLILLTGTVTDIESRKRQDDELRRLLLALEQTPALIVITDTNASILYVNPHFCSVTGYTPDEVLGKNPRILKSGEQPLEFFREMWATLTSGETWTGEMANKKKNGELYWERATIAPMRSVDGTITSYVGVKENVTVERAEAKERSRLQAQLTQTQKMESIGRLAGGIAHDVNNMLAAILGYTDLAARQLGLEHAVVPQLEQVRKAAERSAVLTRQLLTFARKLPYQSTVISANDAIESSLKNLRRLIGEDVAVAWSPEADLWYINADPSQFDQLLRSLVVNSRDATRGRGDPQLHISTANTLLDGTFVAQKHGAQAGAYIRIRVADNGIGMNAPTLASIFEPFFTTKPVGDGPGLGLSVAYGIVKQHRGFIDIASTPDVGTTVDLYFPRTGDPRDASSLAATPAPLKSSGETILLVEDDPNLRALEGEMLRTAGYAVLEAEDGEAARSIVTEHEGPIDLLLTDVIMPRLDGAQLRDAVLKLRPGIKVLFVSGGDADTITNGDALPTSTDLLTKPFSISELTEKLREILDR
jgi:PAS domain S-box-containing protein